MKGKLSLIVSMFIIRLANAQVPNDDCKNAQTVFFKSITQKMQCMTGSNGADTSLFSSNIGSIPNFPYPSNSNSCDGYTSKIAIPANDVWYNIYASPNFSYIFCLNNILDTAHVSFWLGDDCSKLSPFKCFTLVGGINPCKTDTFQGICSPNKVFMQISGNRLGKFINFSMCVWNGGLGCTTYAVNPNTPVLCFNYTIKYTDALSLTANNGTASVNIKGGNAPYTYKWNDGNTDSIRTGLSIGKYYVTIADKNNCTKVDSLTINIANSINESAPEDYISIYPNPSTTTMTIEAKTIKPYIIQLTNLLGEKVYNTNEFSAGKTTIDVGTWPKGIYIVQLIDKSNNSIGRQRLVVQ